jgi:transposase
MNPTNSPNAMGFCGCPNAFCRLKDFRRVATRYDKLAANFLSGVALATALAFWL